MFEGGVDVRVVGEVEKCGRDRRCGCIGSRDDEQFGFTKEFVGAVGDFAGVRVSGLEEVVEHVIPAGGRLFALLGVVVAAVPKGACYFEFTALDYAILDEAVVFLDVGWGEDFE